MMSGNEGQIDLAAIRRAQGLTQSALAVRCRCSERTIRRAEVRTPPTWLAIKIARELGADLDAVWPGAATTSSSPISTELRRRREALGRSQSDVANQIGISTRTLQRAEAGRKLRPAVEVRLRNALGLPVERIADWEQPARFEAPDREVRGKILTLVLSLGWFDDEPDLDLFRRSDQLDDQLFARIVPFYFLKQGTSLSDAVAKFKSIFGAEASGQASDQIASLTAERILQILPARRARTFCMLLKEVSSRADGGLVEALRSGTPDEGLQFLQGLPGIGPTTAGQILTSCFGVPAYPFDADIARAGQRIGVLKGSWDEALRRLCVATEPGEVAGALAALRYVAEKHCEKRYPRCDECRLQWICDTRARELGASCRAR